MSAFNRRAFLGMSAGTIAMLRCPELAFAAPTCVTSGLPSFLPASLTVDCASQKNFRLFRRNTDYLGLAGVVSMTYVSGQWGSYEAGNLFLFPWLKKKGQALGAAKDWQSVFPISATQSMARGPIQNWTMPLDEYFVRYVLQAPWAAFIGFRVDVPFGVNDGRRPWFTNTDKLADGQSVGIAWTSSNLNNPWFAGSRWIPNQDECNGSAWRKLIADGLNRATASAC
jgi:hypothetical protein